MLVWHYHLHTHAHTSLIVLDEIDQLDSKSQEILYTLFEWPALPNSRLVLVGKHYVLVAYTTCIHTKAHTVGEPPTTLN